MDMMRSRLVRAIFRARELALGSTRDDTTRPHGLLAFTQSIGWKVLAEDPGREVVVGAVTRPWEANVTFRPLAPEAFVAFHEPGWVKIAWTLRADALGPCESIFSTETRVVSTDDASKARFQRYWRLASPGILLIRRLMLRPLKREAERRAGRSAPTRAEAT
jgi:hypothetical protein